MLVAVMPADRDMHHKDAGFFNIADRPFSLETCLIVFHGDHARKMPLSIDFLCPKDTVSQLKDKVIVSLDTVPEELEVLVNGEVVTDGTTLLDAGINEQSEVSLLVWYPKEEGSFDDDIASVEDLFPCGYIGVDAGEGVSTLFSDGLGFQEPCEDSAPVQPVPPLLCGSQNEKMTATEPTPKDGARYITVNAIVFLGLHGHRRSCSIRIAGQQARVSDLEEQVEAWLGATPDELTLLLGDDELQSECLLADCDMGSTASISAMAWYKHAVNAHYCALKRSARGSDVEWTCT